MAFCFHRQCRSDGRGLLAVIVVKSEGARAGRPHSRSPPSWTGKLSWNQAPPSSLNALFSSHCVAAHPWSPPLPRLHFSSPCPRRVVTRTVPPPRYSLFTQSVVTKPIQSSAPRNVTDSSRDQPCRPKKVSGTAQIQSTATPVSPEAKQTANSSCELGLLCTTTLPPSPPPIAPSPSGPPGCTPPSPDPQTVRLALSATGTLPSLLSNPGQARPAGACHCHCHRPAPSTRQRQIKIKRDSSLPSAGTPDSIQCSAQPGFCDKKATSPLNARSSLGHRHNAQNSISTILPFWYSS